MSVWIQTWEESDSEKVCKKSEGDISDKETLNNKMTWNTITLSIPLHTGSLTMVEPGN